MSRQSSQSLNAASDGDGLDAGSRRVLRLTRVIWTLLLIEIVVAQALALLNAWVEAFAPKPDLGSTLLGIDVGLTLVLCVIGYVSRMQTYKRFWVGHRVSSEGYFIGNLILFSLLELAAIVGVVDQILAGRLNAAVILVGLCVVLLLINYPTAGPMIGQRGF